MDKFEWKPLLERTYLNMRLRAYCRPVEQSDLINTTEHLEEGWWEIKVEFERLGVPIIRALLAYAPHDRSHIFTVISYGSLLAAGEWLADAFQSQYVNNSAEVLTAAKDMGMRFLTNSEFQEAQAYWITQTAKLEIAEYWYGLNIKGVPHFSEDRYSAFTDAVDTLDFDTPIEGG